MSKKWIVALSLVGIVAVSGMFAANTFSHCQIPCGIYGDEMRFSMMVEHLTTIEKSMKQIEALAEEGPKEANQIVRWVENKDKHAEEFTHIVTYYFLAQRIKPVDSSDSAAHKAYLSKLEMLHNMIVFAMKCKQTTDVENVAKLEDLVEKFHNAYNS